MSVKREIYLDHAATTYLDPRVEKAMLPYGQKKFGNPSALYSKGREAMTAVESARKMVADFFSCLPKEVVFEGSGTESDNHAIIGTALANQARGKHIITTAIEHHAVLHACEFLESQGFTVTYLPVDKSGLVTPKQVVDAVRPDTILVSIMYANNEIGTIEPIAEIAEKLREKNPQIIFHTDACQAAGFFDLNVQKLGVDLLTVNGSKVYGPKGTGALYIRNGVAVANLIHGGAQENSRRAGTENVAGIVGLATALTIAKKEGAKESVRLIKMRDQLIKGLLKMPKVILNGHPFKRLPNNVNVTIADLEGEGLLLYLDSLGISASTGSACTSASLDPSHVITAIGLPYEMAHGSIRFSFGRCNKPSDVSYLLKALPPIIKKLRAMSPVHVEIKIKDKRLGNLRK